MAESPRNKGQYWQPGTFMEVPIVGGSVLSTDGVVECDSVYLQSDYPVLFSVLGTAYNDAGKGDNPATQFRTQQKPTHHTDALTHTLIRF